MKTALYRFLHLFMAVVVLFSSIGVGFAEHSCPMRGKRITFVYSDEAGCGGCQVRSALSAKAGVSVKRATCCLIKLQYSKIGVESSLGHSPVLFLDAVFPVSQLPAIITSTVLPGWLTAVSGWYTWAFPSWLYPLSGRQRLIELQTFLL